MNPVKSQQNIGLIQNLMNRCSNRVKIDGCSCESVDMTTLHLPNNARTFALRVRGNSMIRAGIREKDVVLFEFRDPRHGDIVTALIDGENTLKR